MLNIQYLEAPQDWQKILSHFNPASETWVVADLKSKLEIQQRLFKQHKIIPEESILRASELWLHLYKRLGLESQIVSIHFAKVYLNEKLQHEEEEWLKVPGAHLTLLEYIKQLLPLLIYPDAEEPLKSWWRENPGALMRWGRWFYYAKKYVQQFLAQGWVLPTWIPFILNNDHLQSLTWSRNIYIDLGPQLTQTEAQLFKHLSLQLDVDLLVPCSIHEETFINVKRNYTWLGVSEATEKSSVLSKNENVEYKRFSTSLGEVKDLSAQVRKWIDQGYAPHEIAIVAPDIESYWPVLASYLEVEGLPLQKKQVVRSQSYLPIMNWLSRLKLELGKVSSEDLELEIFSDHQFHDSFTYSEFKKLYSLILDDQQLQRIERIGQRFLRNLSPEKYFYRDEFLLWAISFFNPIFSVSSLEPLLKTMMQETLGHVKLQASSWLNCLGNAAAKTEITIKEEDPTGIYVENLRSARHLSVRCLYLLGLSENNLKSSVKMGVKASEVFKLEKDLGFVLDLPENQELEFAADWLLRSHFSHVVATFSETNFAGESDAAAMLWLKSVISTGNNFDFVNTPQISYWDHLQQNI
ncbi:MAG: hypothetical protein KDD40_08025, partial [Bdellovibrionales bacterium]|nr:hypothetical protein [Bdellovibrionales bacterium]